MMPKYPQVNVKMVGEDGNAFSIIGRVLTAMRKGGVTVAEVKKCQDEMMEGDYDHLLQTVMKWVNVDREEIDEEVADSERDQDLDEDDKEEEAEEDYDEDEDDENASEDD